MLRLWEMEGGRGFLDSLGGGSEEIWEKRLIGVLCVEICLFVHQMISSIVMFAAGKTIPGRRITPMKRGEEPAMW